LDERNGRGKGKDKKGLREEGKERKTKGKDGFSFPFFSPFLVLSLNFPRPPPNFTKETKE